MELNMGMVDAQEYGVEMWCLAPSTPTSTLEGALGDYP